MKLANRGDGDDDGEHLLHPCQVEVIAQLDAPAVQNHWFLPLGPSFSNSLTLIGVT